MNPGKAAVFLLTTLLALNFLRLVLLEGFSDVGHPYRHCWDGDEEWLGEHLNPDDLQGWFDDRELENDWVDAQSALCRRISQSRHLRDNRGAQSRSLSLSRWVTCKQSK